MDTKPHWLDHVPWIDLGNPWHSKIFWIALVILAYSGGAYWNFHTVEPSEVTRAPLVIRPSGLETCNSFIQTLDQIDHNAYRSRGDMAYSLDRVRQLSLDAEPDIREASQEVYTAFVSSHPNTNRPALEHLRDACIEHHYLTVWTR